MAVILLAALPAARAGAAPVAKGPVPDVVEIVVGGAEAAISGAADSAHIPAGYGASLDRWSLIATGVKPDAEGGAGVGAGARTLTVSLPSEEDAAALAAAAAGDPAYFRAPLTGAYTPLRARWSGVKTAVEPGKNADGEPILIGRIPVPEDALVWDSAGASWKKAGPGVFSFSTATYTYIWGVWHTGQAITIADIMYAIAFRAEAAANPGGAGASEPSSPHGSAEPAAPPDPAPEPVPYKGFTLNKDGTLTAYFDFRAQDLNETGAKGAPYLSTVDGASIPWEILEAMKRVSPRTSLSLRELLDGTGAAEIRAVLEEMEAGGFVPPSIAPWTTPGAAAARCRAASDWIGEHGHAFISNGPFLAAGLNATGASLAAFRSAGYPYETTYWKRLVSGRYARIDDVTAPSPAPRTKDARIFVKASAVSYPDGAVSVPDAALKVRLSAAGLKKTYAGIRDKSGQYAVTIPAADLKGLPAGALTISAEAYYTTEQPAVKSAEIMLQ